MTLDPQVEQFLKQMQSVGNAPLHQLQPSDARRQFAEGARVLAKTGRSPNLERVDDVVCPTRHGSIPIRLYIPKGQGLHPLMVFYHGGGFVLGDIDSYDQLASGLAESTKYAVASVDYHLAPEAKFPQAVEECYDALGWLASEGPRKWPISGHTLVVAGDSAGGNIAAVMAQLSMKHEGPSLAAQILYYPAIDMVTVTDSKKLFATGLFLEWEDIVWFGEQYLRTPSDGESPLASPIRSTDLRGLPPALIVTAEYDPLRDEGELYRDALTEVGVPVRHIRVPGMVHGFLSVPFLRAAHEILTATRQFLTDVDVKPTLMS